MRCSRKHIEDMVESPFWNDVLDFIQEEESRIMGELGKTSWDHNGGELELDFHTRLMHDENLRGALRLAGIIKRLPEYLADQAEAEEEERKQERKKE